MSLRAHSGATGTADATNDRAEASSDEFMVSRTMVERTTRFEPHVHRADQLAWVPDGTIEVAVGHDRWQLGRDHVVWIPAALLHEMTLTTARELISVYSLPQLRPPGERWTRPLVLPQSELGCALLTHLGTADPPEPRRRRCHAVLYDLLDASPDAVDALALPRDPRARAIAEAILADPAEARELRDWAAMEGVSTKTLTRAFLAGTGASFAQWRTRARMYAAVRLLTRGELVQDVAGAVGYATPSGFITAFRSVFALTPAQYIKRHLARVD